MDSMEWSFLLHYLVLFNIQEQPTHHDIQVLIKQLESDQITVREEAQRKLVALGEKAVPALTKAVESGRPELSSRARMARKRIQLRGLLGPNLLNRLPNLDRILATGGNEAVLDLLTQAISLRDEGLLSDGDLGLLSQGIKGRTWGSTAEGLIDLASDNEVRSYSPLLVPLLIHDQFDIRNRAAILLGRLEAKDQIPEIARLLTHREARFRASAAGALGFLKAKEYAPSVVGLLRNRNQGIRRTGLVALARMGASEYAGHIAELLDDPVYLVRGNAVTALGMLGLRKRYAAEFLSLLSDENAYVRWKAVQELGDLKSEEYTRKMLPLLKDSDPFVRETTLGALSTLDDPRYANMVAPLLKDSAATVRQRAMRVLAQLDPQGSADKIIPLLGDENVLLVRAAAGTLGRVGTDQTAKAILPFLVDERASVRVFSLVALNSIGADTHVGAVLPFLQEAERDFRELGALTLAELAMRSLDEPDLARIRKALTERTKDAPEGERTVFEIALVRFTAANPKRLTMLIDDVLETPFRNAPALVSALSDVYEHEAYTRLMKRETLKMRLASDEDVINYLKKLGFSVDGKIPLIIDPIYPGHKIRILKILKEESAQLGKAIVIEGKTLRIMESRKALQHWRKRLGGEAPNKRER